MAYHMGRYLNRSCFCCTLLTCYCFLRAMVSALICMQMTPESRLCRPSATLELQYIISTCIDVVARWMHSNRLQVNTEKTEVLWSTSSRRLHLLPVSPLRVGTDQVMPVSVVRILGIYMDADVSMRSHDEPGPWRGGAAHGVLMTRRAVLLVLFSQHSG